jgi:signal transduction histidine kinase
MTGSVLVSALATFLLGGLFLEYSSSHSLDMLLMEEEAETTTAMLASSQPIEDFGSICRELAAHHPETPLAWRLFDATTGAVLASAGTTAILQDHFVVPSAIGVTVPLDRGFAARIAAVGSRFTCLVVVDGRQPRALVDRYWFAATVLIAVSCVVVLALARLLARRAARLLLEVADDVRAATNAQGIASRSGAPDEIRAIVDALQESMQRIDEGSQRLRVFTAGFAHELRSPLQNLIAQAEVSLMRARAPGDYQAVLVSQLDDLRELADAIENLLAVCAAAAPPPRGLHEEFDLGVEAGLRLQRECSRAGREAIDVQVVTTGDMRLRGDRESALRGVRNVVANAIDWSPRAGRVRVEIAGEGSHVVVTVDDSGPGVPVDQRQRICEPFVRGPAPPRRRIGYGLGLAIARAAVVEHGGELTVGTSPFGGARFRLTFQREPVAATPVGYSGGQCSAPGEGR